MPDEAAHIALACHNQDVIDYLMPAVDRFPDWIVTAAFYKSLHIVEALFACEARPSHGQSHERREFLLKSNQRYAHIHRFYRKLQEASTVARYLDAGGNDVTSFLPAEDVRSKVLGHWLPQLEKSAAQFLSESSRKSLL